MCIFQLTSYGGEIRYTVGNAGLVRSSRPTSPPLPGADIKISGKGMTIAYSLIKPMMETDIVVEIHESRWHHDESNAFVTRDQLMSVLVSVSQITSVFVYVSQVMSRLVYVSHLMIF